jgi:hypothetical protein
MAFTIVRTSIKIFMAADDLGGDIERTEHGFPRATHFPRRFPRSIKSGLILGGQVKLATADVRHFGRHDRHELDVGIEWQTRHV